MTEQSHDAMFPHLTDVPVGSIAKDRLWTSNRDPVRAEIEKIATRAIAPLTSQASMNSLVYGVYGEWGSGKSSFLLMLQDRAEELANEVGVSQRFLTVYYNAAVYHGYAASVSRGMSVSPGITLAMRLLGVRQVSVEGGGREEGREVR